MELVCPSAAGGGTLSVECWSAPRRPAVEHRSWSWSAPRRLAVEHCQWSAGLPLGSRRGASELELVCLSAAGGGTLSVECWSAPRRPAVERRSWSWSAPRRLAVEHQSWSWSAPRRLAVEQENCSAAPRQCAAVGLALDSVGIIRFVCREFWLSCGIILLQLWLASLWCDLWRPAPRRLGPCG